MVRINPIRIDSEAWTQDQFSIFVGRVTCVGILLWQATSVGPVQAEVLEAKKRTAGTKGDMSDEGKQGLGKQCQINGLTKGNVGQQWQADAGTKVGKPQEGKGKTLANQQWRHAGNAKGP